MICDFSSRWITGGTRSGKTTRLIELFCDWSVHFSQHYPLQDAFPTVQIKQNKRLKSPGATATILVFAANSNNRIDLVDRILETTQGQYSFNSTTPLGFVQDEVTLFWPVLVESLNLKAQFPVRLRPETEQELATQLWSQELEAGQLRLVGVRPDRMVRQTLDIFQLAAISGTPIDQIPHILEQGFDLSEIPKDLYICMTELLQKWQTWCLERGLLTYSLAGELYGHLLNDSTYQQHLLRRFQGVLADDVDEYPAIAYHLFKFLLDHQIMGAFTFNPEGKIRLGLGADPDYLAELQQFCQIETLDSQAGLAPTFAQPMIELVFNNSGAPVEWLWGSDLIKSIQTHSRSDLLRETAQTIIESVKADQVQPQDIAVIGPGLDAIARYTLREILTHEGIAVESLQEQRPLVSSPLIRALLTLWTLVYPGLGRLVDREAVAEMLVVLSQETPNRKPPTLPSDYRLPTADFFFSARIDPVRAGLLADHCFCPDIEHPHLLPVKTFARWDRLGYQATTAYEQILEWLEVQKQQYQQRLLPSPVSLLDRAIQRFLIPRRTLRCDQLSVLRELIETAIHYWEVDGRLHQRSAIDTPTETIGEFIQLLRRGIVTANPYPVSALGSTPPAVTLATIFQYRAHRKSHRWHFWLDVGSPLWLSGGASTLWGAPLFLRNPEFPWRVEDQMEADEERLRRILVDLLSRVSDRLYLCHSDLAVNGQEQLGPLLSLATPPIAPHHNL